MKYRVVYTTRSNLELQKAALWWAENRSPAQAEKWLACFQAAIAALNENPERHGRAREDEYFDVTLRELYFGLGSKPTHRAVYEIRQDQVIIHAIRHGAQRDIAPDDLSW